MSGITLVSVNPALEASFVDLFGRTAAIRRIWSDRWRDPTDAALDVCAADPELLIIGSDLPQDKARMLVAEVDRRFPATTTVVLVAQPDHDYAIAMLRLGARDVMGEVPGDPAFRADIERLLDVSRSRRQGVLPSGSTIRRRVITVLSPKGGTGKTTMATNLAVGLARRHPNQVVLLDLDTQFGDCATGLALKPTHSLVDAIGALSHERSALKIFLTPHSSGLSLLAAPDDLASADDIESDGIKQLTAVLAEEFPFVVIDTAAGIDAACVAAMGIASDLLFVATPDVPAIRALRRQVDALDQIGMVSHRRTLVLNRSTARVGLSAADVEAAVGLQVEFDIPASKLIPVSTNEGVTVVERDSGNLARRFDEIVTHFSPKLDEGGRGLRLPLRKER